MRRFRVQIRSTGYLSIFLSLTAVLALVACGGGSSGVGTPPPPDDNTIITPPPPVVNTITLEWDLPSTYADGTPMTDFAGCILYYGPSPGFYNHSVDAGKASTYSVTLPLGTWYFSAKAYTAAGILSGFTDEIAVTF